jgi:GAF domain-containing protein
LYRSLEAFEDSIKPLRFDQSEDNKRVPVGSDDISLAAFAQLGALRLDAQRCMISLVCKETEYVLAECTRTLSLQSDLVHNARDALWLGTTHFPRDQGLSVLGVKEWMTTKDQREEPKEEGYYYTNGLTPHWHIISDLRNYPELQKLLLVSTGKNLRFYASVPIRTSSGLVVGSYSILDDRPRLGISTEEMIFMEDIADTVQGHLEAKRIAMQRQRGDRLIKGLALFSEGKDSLRDWWLEGHSRNVRGEGQRRRRGSFDELEERNERANEELGLTYHADGVPRGRNAGPSQMETNLQVPSQLVKPGHLAQDKHEGFDLGREVDGAFARCSNLLREALSAEGVTFVDADFHRSKQEMQNQDVSTGPESDFAVTSSGPDQKKSSKRQPTPVSPEAQCALLGFSTKVKSTLRGFAASPKHSSLPKAFIRSLIRRYPMGKVFNFHDGKALSSSSGTDFDSEEFSESTKQNRSRKRRSRELVDAMTLSNVFSSPRSIAFLPLWDVSFHMSPETIEL